MISGVPDMPSGPQLEEARRMFAELRRTKLVDDPAVRQALTDMAERILAAVAGGLDPDNNTSPELSTREIDVLAHAAVGRKNGEIATALDLSGETVKSYLRSSMAKLGVHSRIAAVERARALGVIP